MALHEAKPFLFIAKMNDKIKAKLSHLQQWLFVFILAIFGMAGWIFTVNAIEIFKVYLAFFGIVFFVIIVIILEIKIIKNIKKLDVRNNNN